MANCRSCNAPIWWARTVKGKAIPLDFEPTIAGNIEVRAGVAHYVTPDHNALGKRFTSHFATCPQSSLWRKGDAD